MGESAQLNFAPKILGEFLSVSSAEQWTTLAQIGRNSPESLEGEPQLRGFAQFARKNIYCVQENANVFNFVFHDPFSEWLSPYLILFPAKRKLNQNYEN
jgi:hypothetical protein